MIWTPETIKRNDPFSVLLKRGEFFDEARDGRSVPYKIYHPVDHDLEKMPVILWSHGFGGNRDGASFISRFLAGQGYILVHLTHYGTDSSLWEGKLGHPWDILREVKISREDTLNRMRDVPFVLDQLPHWAEAHKDVGMHMDFSRMGMSGHSFGAMTTQVMAGQGFPDKGGDLLNLRDKRLSCGILYSPVPIGHLTERAPEEIYSTIDMPLFHMTGTDDQSPLDGYGYDYRLIIKDNAPNADHYVQVLQDGDHMVYNGTRGKLTDNPKREQHEREILDAAFAFWQAYLKDDGGAMAWIKANFRA